jgi:hypothetical protein
MVLGQITDVGSAYDVVFRVIAVSQHVILGIAETRIAKSDEDVQSVSGVEYAQPGRGRRIAGWTLLSAGVAAGGTGLVFGRLAASAQDDAERAATPQRLQEANATVTSHGRTAVVLYAVAGAAVLASGILFLTASSPEEERAWQPTFFATDGAFGLAVVGLLR